MEQDTRTTISYLLKSVYKLMIKTDVQAAALGALARTHPLPDQVEKDFRALIERFHETYEATQPGDEFFGSLTNEVDLFVNALQEFSHLPGQDHSRLSVASSLDNRRPASRLADS